MIRKIGDRLILVGVAHVLPESLEEVETIIKEEEPDAVGVELCRGRYIQLVTGSRSEGISLGNFSREALLASLIRFLQERIGKRTGMLPGDEMLTAIRLARETDAEVTLIDRDINITLSRLLDSLTFWDKVRIVLQLLLLPFFSAEEIKLEDLNDEEAIDELLSQFKDFSEPAYDALVTERDGYMADQIANMLSLGWEKVVCAVGAGHISGISEILESTCDEKFFELKPE